MMSPDTATAFYNSAGIWPSTLLTACRTLLLGLTFVWAVWVVIGTVQNVHSADFTPAVLIVRLLAICVIVMSCIVLIAL